MRLAWRRRRTALGGAHGDELGSEQHWALAKGSKLWVIHLAMATEPRWAIGLALCPALVLALHWVESW